MAVTNWAQRIREAERRAMWRRRWLALADHAALALLVGGLLAAAAVLVIRLKPVATSALIVAAAIFGAAIFFMLLRWWIGRTRPRDAAFDLDRALGLEDRLTTAHAILQSEAPRGPFEEAVLEDADRRLDDLDLSRVAPFRPSRMSALSLVAVAALAGAFLVPQTPLPEAAVTPEARAAIQTAGERLEQASEEIEQSAPAATETAGLAKEQAELGRRLRRASLTRADALKMLSSLEERIRARRDKLAETRADEIASLAEKRLQPVVGELRKEKSPPPTDNAATGDARQPESAGQPASPARDASTPPRDEATKRDERTKAAPPAGGKQPDKPGEPAKEAAQSTGTKPPADAANRDARKDGEKAGESAAGETQNESAQADADSKKPGVAGETAAQPRSGEKQNVEKPAGDSKGADGLTGMIAEQAVKNAPALSEQMLNAAESMRLDQLSAADIQRLAKAAEALAQDLSQIAQSKELQQQLEQLARKVDPEQLERVARELMKNEELRRELESAARLLAENRQVKEMVAGLRQQFEPTDQAPARDRQGNPPGAGEGDRRAETLAALGRQAARPQGAAPPGRGSGRGTSPALGERPLDNSSLTAGREARLRGNAQKGVGGEYLFLQSRPGVGAARAPYSSAYPQYRRQAERSIERSQVPPRMRSVVRRYFDAINPDGRQ